MELESLSSAVDILEEAYNAPMQPVFDIPLRKMKKDELKGVCERHGISTTKANGKNNSMKNVECCNNIQIEGEFKAIYSPNSLPYIRNKVSCIAFLVIHVSSYNL